VRPVVGENPVVTLESYEGENIAILKQDSSKPSAPLKTEESKADADPSPSTRRGRPPKNPPAEESVEHEACKGCRYSYKGKPCNLASFKMQAGKEACSNWWEKKP
jgi:hypothetical protein